MSTLYYVMSIIYTSVLERKKTFFLSREILTFFNSWLKLLINLVTQLLYTPMGFCHFVFAKGMTCKPKLTIGVTCYEYRLMIGYRWSKNNLRWILIAPDSLLYIPSLIPLYFLGNSNRHSVGHGLFKYWNLACFRKF